jgi:hypothetical protein
MSLPKKGTLERLFLDKLLVVNGGVSFLDFVGSGITEDNIEQVAKNLRNGMYESEYDNLIKKDA